ncbi:YdcF family protein [Croceibacterium mercuriale]|uniref:YdcF family protein n=1 Tax=Croceibacterium mercuriale TaxID=1572751 RepID=UPI000AAA65D4|nr:YdcF family protein [Croceibacterium mercuriale]
MSALRLMVRAALAAACVFSGPVLTQAAEPVAVEDAAFAALSQRLFPLFTALAQDPAAMSALMTDPGTRDIMSARATRQATCRQDTGCVAQALLWQEAEIATLAAALPATLPAFDDGVAAQATRELQGVNVILGTYGLGQVPAYPAIDGAGVLDPAERRAWLQAALWLSGTPRGGSLQGMDLSFDFALALLDGSTRTDAVAHLPIEGGMNEAAFTRARRTDWGKYRYTALIVTGIGPELADMPLSPGGKYHLRLAAQQFAAGDAPFIIVSGGRAHPFNTRFTEAVEMRTALIERYGIPADRIVIDPHARHTTTNLRNAARLLVAMGAPLERDTLVVCNPVQSAAIGSPAFVERNQRELGYAPGVAGARISPTLLAWRPDAASARIDPRDPLDP